MLRLFVCVWAPCFKHFVGVLPDVGRAAVVAHRGGRELERVGQKPQIITIRAGHADHSLACDGLIRGQRFAN